MESTKKFILLCTAIFSLVLDGCAAHDRTSQSGKEGNVPSWGSSKSLNFDLMFLMLVHSDGRNPIPGSLVEEYALLHSASYDEYKARKKTGIGVDNYLEMRRQDLVARLKEIEGKTFNIFGQVGFKPYDNSLKGFPIWGKNDSIVIYDINNHDTKKTELVVPATGEQLINPITGPLWTASDVPYLAGSLRLDTRGWYIPIAAEDPAAEYLVHMVRLNGVNEINIVLTFEIKSCTKELELKKPIISCEGTINGGYLYQQHLRQISAGMRPIATLKKVGS